SLEWPRFSPDSTKIAFVESTTNFSGAQALMLLDLSSGRSRTLSSGWELTFGLVWHPKTGEIWFSCRELGGTGTIAVHAISPSGRHRVVARGPDQLVVKDVSREGRVLIERGDYSQTTICLPPAAPKEVDLSWHATSLVADLSNDGKKVLLNEMESG